MNVTIELVLDGKMPKKGSAGAACFDAYAAEPVYLVPGRRRLVSLGFKVRVPEGYALLIQPRSSYTRRGIDVAVGTVDPDYRGVVMANITNNSSIPLDLELGERIAQFRIVETPEVTFQLGDVSKDETARGDGGFGSTGRR